MRRPLSKIIYHYSIAATLLCAVAASIFACKHHDSSQRVLVVSMPVQKWILDSIAGNRYDVVSLLSAGSNPETFEPTMKQLMLLEGAQVYFTLGGIDFELGSLDKIKENFPGLDITDSGRGIHLVSSEHSHSHEHSHEEGHHHDDEEGDPHTWTSLPNARIVARNMYEKLLELDPDGKDYYTSRYQDLDSNLAALHDSVTTALKPLRGKTFMVWHPSLSYFAHDYGLEQVSIETGSKESSPAQYREKIDMASAHKPIIFFTQSEFDPRQARAMAAELKVPTASISLMQPDLPAQIRSLTYALTH